MENCSSSFYFLAFGFEVSIGERLWDEGMDESTGGDPGHQYIEQQLWLEQTSSDIDV